MSSGAPLSQAQWQLVNELFDAAVEMPSADRTAFLQVKSANDDAVLKEVLGLVKAHERSETFLETPAVNLTAASLLDKVREAALSQVGGFGTATASATARPGPLTTGEVIEDFEIIRQVGAGAFARVYLARQLSLARYVALKISTWSAGGLPREARTMAKLEHDLIVQVFSESVAEGRGLRLICMQYVQGPTLQDLIRKLADVPVAARSGATLLAAVEALCSESDAAGALGGASLTAFNAAASRERETVAASDYVSACLSLAACLAEALAFAHARGILHLDVKPANILLNRYGRPLLTDFNVSLAPEDLGDSGDRAVLGGTFAYMSPEQRKVFHSRDPAGLAAIDQRSDVYSLAMVVAELLTCRRAETIEEPDGTTVLKCEAELPDVVASVLQVALRKNPGQRFESAGAFAGALTNCREIMRVRHALAANGRMARFLNLAERHPVTALVAVAIVPQVLGSVVNIIYNTVRIAADLTPAQREHFQSLILPYNLIVYPLGIYIIWRQLAFLVSNLQTRSDRSAPNPEKMAGLRRRVLWTPRALLLASTIGWVPGAVLFPLAIDVFSGGALAPSTYGHFALSFLSSWLIALTYSYLWLEAVVLRVIYPRFWTGCCDIRVASRRELSRVDGRLRLFQALSGLIPLAGAIMIVSVGPAAIAPEQYHVFQAMVAGLITLGMLGFVSTMRTTDSLRRTVIAFTG